MYKANPKNKNTSVGSEFRQGIRQGFQSLFYCIICVINYLVISKLNHVRSILPITEDGLIR